MEFHSHGHAPAASSGLLRDHPNPRLSSSRLNRSTPILTMLNYSCLALGGRLDGELATFWKSVGFADLPFESVVERFAHFLKRRVENGTLRIYFLPELLDFELAMKELRFMSRGPYLEGGAPREPRVLVQRGAHLELHPLMRISRFPCDAQALFETLAHGDCIDCNVRSHEDFLLLSVLRDAVPEVLPIPPALGRKLWALQCVGTFGGCAEDVASADRLIAAPLPH